MASNKKKYESGSKRKKLSSAATIKKSALSSTLNELKTVTAVKILMSPTLEKNKTARKVKKLTVTSSQKEFVPSLTSKEYNLSGANKPSKSSSLKNDKPRVKKFAGSFPMAIAKEIPPTISKLIPLVEPPQLTMAKKIVSMTPLKNLRPIPTLKELCPAIAQKFTSSTNDKKQSRLSNGSILTLTSDPKPKQPESKAKKIHSKNIAEKMSPICKRKELISLTLAKKLALSYKEFKIDLANKRQSESKVRGIAEIVESPLKNLPVSAIKKLVSLSARSIAATKKTVKKISSGISGKQVAINSKKIPDAKEPIPVKFERRVTIDKNVIPVPILKKASTSKYKSVSSNKKYIPDSRVKKISSVATIKSQGVISTINNKTTPMPQIDKSAPRIAVKELILESKNEKPLSNVKKVCTKKVELISKEKISSNNSSIRSKLSIVSKKTRSLSNSIKNNSISSQDKVSNKSTGTRIGVSTKGSIISGQSGKTKISVESRRNGSSTNSKTNESGNTRKTGTKSPKCRT